MVKQLQLKYLFPILTTLFTLIPWCGNSQDNYITPEGFNWMTRTSINILKTYRTYQGFIKEYDPIYLLDANTIQTAEKNYYIPTSFGDVHVGPIQLEMALYFRWQTKKEIKFGFFAFANSLDLQIDETSHPNLRDVNGPYGDLYGWKSGKMIIGMNSKINENIDLTIAALVTQRPYVTLNENGTDQFDMYYKENEDEDEEKGEYLLNLDSEEFFFSGDFYGYQIGTFYDLRERVFSLIDFKRNFGLGEKFGVAALAFRHYNYRKTMQLGIEYHNPLVFSDFSFDFESYWNIHNKKDWYEISYVVLSAGKTFLKDKHPVVQNNGKKDFYIELKSGISYSTDIFSEGLTGYFFTVDFTNIWGVWHNLIVGYSYNYFEYLRRLPIENEHGIIICFRIMVQDYHRLKRKSNKQVKN